MYKEYPQKTKVYNNCKREPKTGIYSDVFGFSGFLI